MSSRASESPGVPEIAGSEPRTFAPAPYATRPLPDYPHRADYAIFDPALSFATDATIPSPQAFPRATIATMITPLAPIVQRASSEPYARWWKQNDVVDGRHASVPPALETAPLTLRERMLYPDRTMHEITDYVSPPIVESRSWVSESITEDAPVDWGYGWPDENDPHRTHWVGYDNSRYTKYGGRDSPNETAAVANEQVLQSIELESDPLVALRQSARDSQAVIRPELAGRIRLEDRNRELEGMIEEFRTNEDAFERSQRSLLERLEFAETEREQFRTERDTAVRQNEHLLLQFRGPEGERGRREAQRRAYTEALRREARLVERVQTLEQSETTLRHQLYSSSESRQEQQEQVDPQSDMQEWEWNQFEEHFEQQRNLNHDLQAQVDTLTAQLVATQALQVQDPFNQLPVDTTPNNPPPVLQPPVTEAAARSAGSGGNRRARGGRGSRAGRGGRGATTEVRRQPKRSCKVEKSYRK